MIDFILVYNSEYKLLVCNEHVKLKLYENKNNGSDTMEGWIICMYLESLNNVNVLVFLEFIVT